MKIIILTAALLIIQVTGFFLFNAYIYNEKQADTGTPEMSERQVTIISFEAEEIGLAYEYLSGPDGYTVEEITDFASEDETELEVVRVYRIMNTKEKEELENSTEGREGPPAIQVAVYENSQNQSASMWVDAFPLFSNIERALGIVNRDDAAGGVNAVRYTSDGLYLTDNVVVANGRYIYHFSGSYLELDSDIRSDFSALIDSLRFTNSAPMTQPAPIINVATPTPQQTVASPISLTGEAQGNWFFEATAPVVVVNWNGLIIGEGYIEAEGDWMTTDLVPFSGTVTFDLPVDSYSASGTVIFQRANPSDLPENDAAVEIQVVLE